MKINELTQNEKDMEFKPLDIKKEVLDQVMNYFGFTNVSHAFEAGILALQTLAVAASQGAPKIFFEKDIEGKKYYYEWNFLKVIESVKDPNRPEGSIHSVELNTKDKA